MNKKLVVLLSILVLAFSLTSTAYADIGPKAFVKVTFNRMGDELCYGTLLSETDSTGPWATVELRGPRNDDDIPEEIWQKFVDYEDPDGYHYLQQTWVVSEEKEISWTYHPPYFFKVLLYYPESDTFLVSDIHVRYAFDTYYAVNMARADMTGEDLLPVQYGPYMTWLGVRVVATVLLELGIAWLYGFRKKEQYKLLLTTNVVTQLALNLLLTANIRYPIVSETLSYFILELAVIVGETLVYNTRLRRIDPREKPGDYYLKYAIVANLASLLCGGVLSLLAEMAK